MQAEISGTILNFQCIWELDKSLDDMIKVIKPSQVQLLLNNQLSSSDLFWQAQSDLPERERESGQLPNLIFRVCCRFSFRPHCWSYFEAKLFEDLRKRNPEWK